MITLFRPRAVSRTILLLLFHCLLHGFRDPVLAEIPEKLCSDNGSYATNSTYEDNLKELTSSMQKNASFSKFFQDSSGNYPDKVYGQYMCLDYVSNSTCQTCIAHGSEDVLKLCPNKKEAVIWEESCQLRISGQEFFGRLTEGYKHQFNPGNISDPGKFGLVVNDFFIFLAQKTVLWSPGTHYATTEQGFELDSSRTLYAFLQCTEDLTADDCHKCLQEAIRDVRDCCYFSRGARVLSPSCYLRYELYPLYTKPEPVKKSGKPDQKEKSGLGKGRMILLVVCILAGASLLSLAVCVAHRRLKRITTRGSAVGKELDGTTKDQVLPLFDITTIRAATDNFASMNKLGQGGFGPVYKGRLASGQEVAVKRLSKSSGQGSQEFKNEVMLIAKLQHRNLVRLLGCCISQDERMLIYEYLPNKSLDCFIFNEANRTTLDWNQRSKIILGIARGVLYLHQDSRLKIIHRDLKASNVLLDSAMNQKISDFGMAKMFGEDQIQANTNRVVGTYGYMSPEYAMQGLYSIKSDVFSFGVMLLEIVSGKRNTDFYNHSASLNLIAHVWNLWKEGKDSDIVDSLMGQSYNSHQVLRSVQIGLLCVQENAADRPTMMDIVLMLGSEAALASPNKPAFILNGSGNVLDVPLIAGASENKVTITDLEGR